MSESPAHADSHRQPSEASKAAVDSLFSAAYQDLHALARFRLNSGGRDAVLDTTALVHESFLRLAHAGRVLPAERTQFLRYASRAMRSVIVDWVRSRRTARRGAGAEHLPLTTRIGDSSLSDEEKILRIHEALEEIAALDPRMAQVVEMRYFAGMTEIEIAEALGIADRTVRRTWSKARMLLSRALE